MRRLRDEAMKLVFPPRCPSCDGILAPDETGFCRDCEKLIQRVEGSYCIRCGRRLDKATAIMCADCSRKKHNFSEGRSLYVYEGPMREAMYRFKYSGRRSYAEAFAYDAERMWGDWVRYTGTDIVAPVPMNAIKRRQRGYDQAAVFAKALAEAMGITYAPLLERIRKTPPMKGLTPDERRRNLKNAFQVRHFDVKSKRVLLADDIYTTGSTMDAAAEALLKCGAADVCGIFICTGQ